MKINYILILIVLFCSCSDKSNNHTQYVDPFIGTGSHGHTYPGAQVPFGMVQLSPDTRNDESWDGCGGYHYSDNSIIGFSHTHLSGTGVSDYGDILLMPITTDVELSPGTREHPEKGYRSRFSHKSEKAEPGYYTVFLDDYNVKVELTAGERVGYHKYTFNDEGEIKILLDLIHRDPVIESQINIKNQHTIIGQRRSKYWAGDQQLFFAMEFSKPFKSTKIYDNKNIIVKTKANGKALQSILTFDVTSGETIEIKVALSNVSTDGAYNNLKKESKGINFDIAKENAHKLWENSLSRIDVEGGTLKQKRIFYTSLYHSLLTPNISEDCDGRYRGMDGEVHQSKGFTNYTVFSLWDTFRALHPLLTILEPQRTNDFAQCLVQKSKEFGEFPMWELASNDTRCMIGYHAVSVIADAYAKGITDFDIQAAYEEMLRTSMKDKKGLKAYRTLGYVPSNKSSQSVSKTLEYAYNDWCIAQIAKHINKTEQYDYYMARASNYRKIYDPSVGFMRGKKDDHSWVSPFDPTAVGYNYTEGNSYQYSLFVPHDMTGLIEIIGGEKALERWLDNLFTTDMIHDLGEDTDVSGLIGQYAHGNEPSHNMAYLYNYSGTAWKTQKMVRKIMNTQYSDDPEGLCGNEDCGQMSAWYVLSAMGFYPDCPGKTSYLIGSPLFSKITIKLNNGKKFTIKGNNNSSKNSYIQSAGLNNTELKICQIDHFDILKGGLLNLEMGDIPNKNWGRLINVKKKKIVSTPYLAETSDNFIDCFTVDIKCDYPKAKIYYTVDNSEPTELSNLYTKPFKLYDSCTIKLRAYDKDNKPSLVVKRELIKQKSFNINMKNLKKGLQYSYYEGIYRSIYDYKLDPPTKVGVVDSPSLDVCSRKEWIGVDFKGWIKIPKSGEYSFYIAANDGCKLSIDNKELFESDGRKSIAFEQEGHIKLKKGFHPIHIGFYQCSDNIHLDVQWKGPKFSRQVIPKTVFFH